MSAADPDAMEWKHLREDLSFRERYRIGRLIWRSRAGSNERDAHLALARARYELSRLWLLPIWGGPSVAAGYFLLKAAFQGWERAIDDLWLGVSVAIFFAAWFPFSQRRTLEKAEAANVDALRFLQGETAT